MIRLINLLFLSFLWMCGFRESDSCGLTTHIEIGQRIRHFVDIDSQGINYSELIQKHPDAYQAGCPYPDLFWPDICYDGIYDSISEDTHWVPFINTSITYIRDNYPRPWNETGEKLVVFILGIVAHQVSDVNWHSRNIDQGFLLAMGNLNYHGSIWDAHTPGDLGGDVLIQYGLVVDYLVESWYVPIQDLVNIYDLYYGEAGHVTAEMIQNCTDILYKGTVLENIGALEYLYPFHAADSPFLVDRLYDYYLGGVDDMAAWASNIFQHTVTMLDYGTQVCHLPKNPIFIECNTTSTGDDNQHLKDDNSLYNEADSEMNWLQDVITLVEDFVVESDASNQDTISSLNTDSVDKYITGYDALYYTQLNYSRLGESLLSGDVNNDGDLDLIVAAPGYSVQGNYQKGRVYVIYGSHQGLPIQNLTMENDANLIFEGIQPNSRFGTSLAVVDINADGFNDLAIGAPSAGSSLLEYYGEVYVYFGSASGVSTDPNVTITCTERYCNLGTTLTSGDVTHDGFNDLIIGAPYAPSGGQQRGFVGILFSDSNTKGGMLTEGNLDWSWSGSLDYEWFGRSITVVNTSPTSGQLIVGSPTYRVCALSNCSYDTEDIQSAGRISTFSIPLDNMTDWYISNTSMAQLGDIVHSYSQGDDKLLAVAASTRDYQDIDPTNRTEDTHLGHVTVYDWSDTSWQKFFSVVGDREFCRFGAEIQFVDMNGDSVADVIISAPLRSESFRNLREEGRVYVFYNDESKRGKTFIASQSDLILSLGEEKSRYGYGVTPVVSSQALVQLAVSAPHSNLYGRLTGLVSVHTL